MLTETNVQFKIIGQGPARALPSVWTQDQWQQGRPPGSAGGLQQESCSLGKVRVGSQLSVPGNLTLSPLLVFVQVRTSSTRVPERPQQA
jgi:hypothetical protein